MGKININEYVRTISGTIDKVDALYGMIENTIHLEKHKWQDIINHSSDKIDLLEVGDLILYKCININSDKLELDIIKDEVDLQDYKNRFKSNFWQLVSFVTKEKLNSVLYNE